MIINVNLKISKIWLEKVAKLQNLSENELDQIEKLQRKSIDELKEIARLRRIKNIEKLRKEDRIIAFLKSENSTAEHNFEKIFIIIMLMLMMILMMIE